MIQRVWVEMLSLSASRRRGYLHAKASANGGEFLSYVWLLLSRTHGDGDLHTTERLQSAEGGAASKPGSTERRRHCFNDS